MPLTRPKLSQVVTQISKFNDPIVEINASLGDAQANADDIGIVFKRGSSGDNAILVWDRSAGEFALGTTTATGGSSGDLTLSGYADLHVGALITSGLAFPTSDGTNGQVLTTDGGGNLTFQDPPSGLSNVVEDTTPQLGGDLDLNSNKLVDGAATALDFTINPAGTDYLTVSNAVTSASLTAAPTLGVAGTGATNIQIKPASQSDFVYVDGNLAIHGTAAITDSSEYELFKFDGVASAVNAIEVTNAATGNGPRLAAWGDDANIDFILKAKGTGVIDAESELNVIDGLLLSGGDITGNFTGPAASRPVFQSNQTNGLTAVEAIPNGTGTEAFFVVENNSTILNNEVFSFGISGTEAIIQSYSRGTGTTLPINFKIDSSTVFLMNTDGTLTSNVADYETLVTNDDDIPNKKYVDDAITAGSLQSEVNDLTAAVTWANVPDANITQSSVTQHQAALSIATSQLTGDMPDARIVASNVTQHQAALAITESQISDLGNYAATDVANTFTTNQVIETSSTSAALRVTQTGTGHALLVEDAANPDASPFYIDNAGNCVIAGDLTVNGTTTTVNTETINLADNLIVVNSNETGVPSQNGGIEVERGTSANVSIQWNEATDVWQVTDTSGTYDILTSATSYLTAESNDLTASVTWANVPDANITQSSVTQHEAALTITESQISDLGTYLSNIVEDTTPQLGGNLDVQGNDIIGDFSNASIDARPAWVTSAANSNTTFITKPNGTGSASYIIAVNESDATNSQFMLLGMSGADGFLQSSAFGTGTVVGMSFLVGNTTRFRIETDGTLNVDGTTDYEDLVLNDDDIPNKKYVDDNTISELLDDTTPQLGGTLDTNGNTIDNALGTVDFISPITVESNYPSIDLTDSNSGTNTKTSRIVHNSDKFAILSLNDSDVYIADDYSIGKNSSGASVHRMFIGSTETVTVTSGLLTVAGNIVPDADGTRDIGTSSLGYGTIYGEATAAQYADLAENYVADQYYAPGTVLSFGGDEEVTGCIKDHSRNIVGVVSTNPAHLMNAGCEGEYVVAIALMGRVPCKVSGPIEKGDLLVSDGNGGARAEEDPKYGAIIGRAIESFDGDSGVIEVLVGRV